MNGPGVSRTLRPFFETRERRQRLSVEYREQLLAELASKLLDASSASACAMIDLAVSARLQVSELSRQFADNRATPKAQVQLSLARGQLQRALRALKLVDQDNDSRAEEETPAEWLARRAGGGV